MLSTGNTRKYHQIDVYIYQCEYGTSEVKLKPWSTIDDIVL